MGQVEPCLQEMCIEAKITRRSQMCLLDNTVVICVWIILVLKIVDSLLELAKQSVLEIEGFSPLL